MGAGANLLMRRMRPLSEGPLWSPERAAMICWFLLVKGSARPLLVGEGAPKPAWGHAGDFSESTAKMTLVSEAELDRNIDKHAPLGDQFLGLGNAFVKNVPVRCHSKCV
jgi:hypothetical protein